MEALAPPALKPGDTIALVSTARKVDVSFIEYAERTLASWGFKTRRGDNLFKVHHQFAGSDAARRADLRAALENPDIKAVICARGGYGTARIIDDIDFSVLDRNPKWVAGYSDVTALHSHIYNKAGLQSIHGTMPVNFADNTPESLESLRLLLTGNFLSYTAPSHRLNRTGKAEGVMLGGNLSVLYSMAASASELNTAGAVLFLEDLDEYLYHIDRMMLALKRADKLAKLAGLVVGGMTDMRDNAMPFGKTAEEIIAEHTAAYAYPVCFSFPAGHITGNRAWLHGKKVRLTVKNDQPSSLNHC